MNIYISPSNQSGNAYALPGMTEEINMEATGKLMLEELQKYNCNARLATLTKFYGDRPEEAKAWGADLYVAIHTNATGTTNHTAAGAIGYYNPDSGNSRALVKRMVDTMDAISPVPSNRIAANRVTVRTTLAETREPIAYKMDLAFLEINFHDNPNIAPWLVQERALIAKTLVAQIVAVYNLSLKMVFYKLGDSGEGVRKLQSDLVSLGWSIPIDGNFGPLTQAAVIEFQTKNGLTVDGSAGPITLAMIIQRLAEMNVEQPLGNGEWLRVVAKSCKYRSEAERIRDELKKAGYDAFLVFYKES